MATLTGDIRQGTPFQTSSLDTVGLAGGQSSSNFCPLMVTCSLWGRDQPRGAAGSILDVICQNSLVCSSREASLFCELTGHGLGTKADPEKMEFRWPESAALCPLGMPSWLLPQGQGSSLWLLQVLTGVLDETHMPLTVHTLCPAGVSVTTLWTTTWAFRPFSTGKAMSQCPQHLNPRRQLPVPSGETPRPGWRRPKALLPAPEGLCQPRDLPLDHPPSLAGCCFLKLLLLWQVQFMGAQASPSAPGSKDFSLLPTSQDFEYPMPWATYGCTHCSLDITAQKCSGPDSHCPAWD